MVSQLWADVKYHVPTGFGFSPKASGFLCFCFSAPSIEIICNFKKQRHIKIRKRGNLLGFPRFCCGKGGIRTLGTRKGTTVFETVPFGHSGTFPICVYNFFSDAIAAVLSSDLKT